jgi:predicted pyridoxine 5'-phosphate oxidase superfamily flavin-nucleotide-binding protein
VERRDADFDQGVDRLVAVVTQRRADGAARLVRDVIEGSHTAVKRDDDVCVLAAVRTAAPPGADLPGP